MTDSKKNIQKENSSIFGNSFGDAKIFLSSKRCKARIYEKFSTTQCFIAPHDYMYKS